MKKITLFIGIIVILVLGFVGYKYLNVNQQTTTTNINNEKILLVGVNVEYEPMEFFDESGNIIGLDIDIISEIANKLGLTLKLVDYGWEELFVAVKSGDVDLAISSITITAERQKELSFSAPYFNGGQIIIVRNETADILTPPDLKSKKVGVLAESTSKEAALEYVLPKLLTSFTSDIFTVQNLLDKTIDAIVMDYVAATAVVKNNPSLKIVGEPFTQEFYGIATQLNNQSLINDINLALREMKRDGSLEQIVNKWLK